MADNLQQNRSRSAVVTGASQGIGKAIAVALAQEGINTVLASRSIEKLDAVRKEIGDSAGWLKSMQLDLSDLSSIADFAANIHSHLQQLNILIHCGGTYGRGNLEDASSESISKLFETNVRGACALTSSLLPLLKEAHGDIVFINSTIVFSAAGNTGAFAATQHALIGIANALRAEVNEDGVRVLTVYPGRTATPRQEKIFGFEKLDYQPDTLLQPSDVAEIVVACLKLPETAEVIDLCIRPRKKW